MVNLPNKRWFLALIPAVITASWLTDQLGVAPPPLVTDTILAPEESYDGFGRHVRTDIYDENGMRTYMLTAVEQRLFPDQITDLDQPLLLAFEEDRERWNISANSGRIRATSGGDIQQLDLQHNVEVRHELSPDDIITLRTDWLTLQPPQQNLYTDTMVHVYGDGIDQTAQGMRADLSINRLEFLSDIQGRYYRVEP